MIRKMAALALTLAWGAFAGEQKTYTPDFTAVDSIHATVKTQYGTMVFRLEPRKAPVTVANFIELSKKKFYDGLKFHRVIPGFMVQGGDPAGNGTGGPGYTIKDEFSDLKHVPGALSMANAGPNTGGSQFFICQTNQSHLNGKHSVFGQLISGWDVSCLIEQNDVIQEVSIQEFKKR
jgi:cyclophilin family peptidyl-prolyl cis-trans isomerase